MEAQPDEIADNSAEGVTDDIINLSPTEDEDILGYLNQEREESSIDRYSFPAFFLIGKKNSVRDEEQDIIEILDSFCFAVWFPCQPGTIGPEEAKDCVASG